MSPMLAMAPCFGCGANFAFNPDLVPSIRDPNTSAKQPICASCVDAVNPLRVANGLDPIVPLAGAYEPTEG